MSSDSARWAYEHGGGAERAPRDPDGSVSGVDRMNLLGHCEHDNEADVCPACELDRARAAGVRLADAAERLLDERDDARRQLRGAVDALVLARNELHRACLGLGSTEGFTKTFETLNAAIRANRGQ